MAINPFTTYLGRIGCFQAKEYCILGFEYKPNDNTIRVWQDNGFGGPYPMNLVYLL